VAAKNVAAQHYLKKISEDVHLLKASKGRKADLRRLLDESTSLMVKELEVNEGLRHDHNSQGMPFDTRSTIQGVAAFRGG